jgi:hypothetical protein
MADDGMLSIRAYAKHRGCSDGAVRKAIEKGKIHATGSGKETRIDPVAADAEWAANTRTPVRTKAEGAHDGAHLRTEAEGSRYKYARELDNAAASDESKADAERRKEVALANIREHEYRIKSGTSVDRQAVTDAWFAVARNARDQLMGVVDRLALRLYLTPEQTEIVTEEMRGVLVQLAKETPGLGDPLPEPVEM